MKKFIVLDTEATNTGRADSRNFGVGASVYDLGFVVADASGAIYEQHSMALMDVLDDPALMASAYYADKLPQYHEGIKTGEWQPTITREALRTLRDAIKRYNVKDVWAYNARFDRDALNSSVSQASNGFVSWALPYGVCWRDILPLTRATVGSTKKYAKFCEDNGLMTAHKTPRPRMTADSVGKYLHGKDYAERHTALSDAQDELAILLKCLKYRKKLPKRFN